MAQEAGALRGHRDPLRVKLGLDPTAPDIHVGHTVVLNKLRHLQDLGHTVIFLIGDFTSMIGDPSGRNTTRPPLTKRADRGQRRDLPHPGVQDPGPRPHRTSLQLRVERPARRARNDPAGGPLHSGPDDGKRNDFHKRFTEGRSISVHEFLYPLMQGYDSVALKSDLELGGTDQKFNLLMGRHLQQEYGQEPQCILTMPLLEGLDGVDKMSKSKNNYIGISEDANTMFAKVMSISDTLMWRWYTLLSFRSEAQIAALKAEVEGRPQSARRQGGAGQGDHRPLPRCRRGRRGGAGLRQPQQGRHPGRHPRGVAHRRAPGHRALLKQAGLAPSSSEANRLMDGGGVRIDSAWSATRA
jgi:tyrosyl-tRNA synthetase